MPATSIQSPFPIFTDIDGQPLEQGQVWLGTAGNNPISSPITAYWDAALTQVVTQPVTTRGGYPLNGTAVGRLYVNADFSILVRNRRGYDVLSALSATERFDSSLVTFVQAGLGAVTRTAQAKMRDIVSVKDFGADSTGVASSSSAIISAQNYLASIGGGTLYFPPGQYRVTTPIPMQPGITYTGPMKAGLASYNPNRSRLFSTTGNVFTNAATAITEVAFRDLFIESESGGGHVFDWSSAGLVAKIEMSVVCLAQRNANKCVIYGQSTGGVFSIWMHDFEYVYVPACLYPPIWIASTTVNSIVIEKFWSTANGQSAAGNPSVWIESTNPSGAAFNVTLRQGVFELPGSGSVILKSVTNSVIEDCSVYDLSITPGYYQFAIVKGPTGPASSNCALRRCRSTVGTAGFPDLFVDMSVAGQGDILVEQCTFLYADGSVSSQGSKIVLINSAITNKANFPYLELSGPTNQLHFGATAGTSADVSFWNGYPGNRDGALNVTVNGVFSGSFSKNGVFSWGNAYMTQTGIINAGAQMYPGTPTGAQQVSAGLLAGAGAPNNADGNNGDFYFRSDGAAGTSVYMKRAGAWAGIV
jgi:hypothetical protein